MMSQRQLLIIGGTSGMGLEFFKSARSLGDYGPVMNPDPGTLDVTDTSSVEWYFKYLRTDHKVAAALDVAYFAGYNRLMPLGSINAVSLRHTFAVNVEGFINVIDAMCKYGWDLTNVNFTAIASDAARIPMRHSIAYCSSKAALVMAVRCAARELAPKWRVNAVSPGVVAGTPMSDQTDREVKRQRGWSKEEADDYERSMIPMGRRATMAEVGQVVMQTLRGPEYLTGANIEINGGK